jgi:hypothetical protein
MALTGITLSGLSEKLYIQMLYILNIKLEINNIKGGTMDKQVRTLYSWFILGLWFIAWGLACLFLYEMGPVWKGELLVLLIGSSFIIVGTVFFSFALREISRYKKTGKVKVRRDERSELNALRASRRGFVFFLESMMVLFLLWGFKIINDAVFVVLTGIVLFIGSYVFLLSLYLYERRG